VKVGAGITISRSNGNRVFGNMISEANSIGIHLESSNNNTFYGNTIAESYYGLGIGLANDNIFHHNNFIDNTDQILTVFTPIPFNSWNNSIEGNYWSDYNGQDLDHDGKGDSPYILDSNNKDHHPLMGIFSDFNTSLGKHVNVISNSTIEDFSYFESNSTINMHVSNMTGNQTHGFVGITIPHALMTEPYNVTIDGANPIYWNYTLHDNGTHRWIFFEYEHSELEIIIVPEFSLQIILPLFMIVTLLAVLVHRRKDSRAHKLRAKVIKTNAWKIGWEMP
jgi:parallel beta-helix repeat protein